MLKPMAKSHVNGRESLNSLCARMPAAKMKANMTAATCSNTRAELQRRSRNAPRPAMPSAKIAASMRAVSGVSFHGQMLIACVGNTYMNAAITTAHTLHLGRHVRVPDGPKVFNGRKNGR